MAKRPLSAKATQAVGAGPMDMAWGTAAKTTSSVEADPMAWDIADAKFCLAIGRFVVAFSQLEFSLRFPLGSALQLTDEQFDAVTATYDFSALCRVTKAVYLAKHVGDDERCRAIEELIWPRFSKLRCSCRTVSRDAASR